MRYPTTYILSPIQHKESVELTPDVTLMVDKSFENNLRERNPQLGTVEAVPEDNVYNLKVGDIIAVNHRTFYGNIGANRGFIWQDHFEQDGKRYFKVLLEQMLFKYNNRTPEPLGENIICTNVEEIATIKTEANQDLTFVRQKEFSQTGTVLFGDEDLSAGTKILTLKFAFYLITLDRVDYFKVKKSEIVAKIVNDEAIPFGRHMLIEYEPEYKHPFLDLSMVKKPNVVKAKVLSGAKLPFAEMIHWKAEGNPEDGETVLAYRNQGVEYKEKRLVDTEMIVWRFDYEKA